jgi:hypothetical protein
MSKADKYIEAVILKHRKETGQTSQAYHIAQKFTPILRGWAGETLVEISFAGSYAKDTSVDGSTDADLLILLDAHTCGEMKGLYDNLYSYLDSKSLGPLHRKISIGLNYFGATFDILLARKLRTNQEVHDLYSNKRKTCLQTNVIRHSDLIANSGCCEEIRAVKIWSHLNNLIFPSFYLELTVLNLFANRRKKQLSENFLAVIDYLKDNFIHQQVLDPINSNNIISDDSTGEEKSTITKTAFRTLSQANWAEMIW